MLHCECGPLMVHGAQSASMCEHTPSHMLFVSDMWATVSILHCTKSWSLTKYDIQDDTRYM